MAAADARMYEDKANRKGRGQDIEGATVRAAAGIL